MLPEHARHPDLPALRRRLLAGGAERARPAAEPTLEQLVGQKLVVSMTGTTPSASLLARARRGDIGGVIVHRFNFSSSAQLRAIAAALQRAAASGGRPRLLIAVDQEGGSVKTIPWLPPVRAPGRVRSTADARADGRSTGAALLDLGVNTDFAPVADVPGSTGSEVYRQGRTWSFDAKTTARLAGAFALGLGDAHALATMKHFPGLGLATENTDRVGRPHHRPRCAARARPRALPRHPCPAGHALERDLQRVRPDRTPPAGRVRSRRSSCAASSAFRA